MVRRTFAILIVALAALVPVSGVSAAPTWKPPVDLGPVSPSIAAPAPFPVGELDVKGNAVVLVQDCDQYGGPAICGGTDIFVKTRRARAGSPWVSKKLDESASGFPSGDLDVSPAGHAAVVWVHVNQEVSQTETFISTRRPGGMWTTPKRLSAPGETFPYGSKVAIDDRGAVVAVWAEGSGADGEIMYRQRTAGGTWSTIKRASRVGKESLTADVAVNGAGVGLILFAGEEDTEGLFSMWARRRTSRTGPWSSPQSMSATTASPYNLNVPNTAVARNGDMLAAWTRWDSGYRLESVERQTGEPWTAVKDVAGVAAVQSSSMGDSPNGRVAFVWQESTPANRGRKHRIGQGWTSAQTLPQTAGTSTSVQYADVNDAGKVILARGEGRSVPPEQDPDGYEAVIRSAISSAGGAAWGTLVRASPLFPNTSLGSVSIDGKGNAIVGAQRWSPTQRYEVIPYDASGPIMSGLRVPRSGRDDTLLHFEVSPYDVWSALAGNTKWIFGDGTSIFGNNVNYSYASPGNYNIKVTRTDSVGNKTTVTRRIRINP